MEKPRAFNVSFRRNGGLYFLKIGRIGFSFYIAKQYKPIKGAARQGRGLLNWRGANRASPIRQASQSCKA